MKPWSIQVFFNTTNEETKKWEKVEEKEEIKND